MKEKDLTFEDKLWKAADKLRKKVEVHEYKYIVLGLIFLRYVSFAFEEVRERIKEKYKNDPDLKKYLKIGMNIFQKEFYMFQKRQGGII